MYLRHVLLLPILLGPTWLAGAVGGQPVSTLLTVSCMQVVVATLIAFLLGYRISAGEKGRNEQSEGSCGRPERKSTAENDH
jgi:hypothetical protein